MRSIAECGMRNGPRSVEVYRGRIIDKLFIETVERRWPLNHFAGVEKHAFIFKIFFDETRRIGDTVAPEQLFDGIRDQLRLIDELPPVRRAAGEEARTERHGRRHRVETSTQQNPAQS